MASDKVVLTGGLGMVGSHVTRALVRSGQRPVVYDAGNDTELVSDVAAQCDMVQGGVEDMPRFISVLREHRPCAILHFAAPGRFRAYNIASGELISLAQIIAVLRRLYPAWDGRAGTGLDYRNMGVGHYFAMAIGKAERELDYKPQLDFASAVRDYAALLKVRDQATVRIGNLTL